MIELLIKVDDRKAVYNDLNENDIVDCLRGVTYDFYICLDVSQNLYLWTVNDCIGEAQLRGIEKFLEKCLPRIDKKKIDNVIELIRLAFEGGDKDLPEMSSNPFVSVTLPEPVLCLNIPPEITIKVIAGRVDKNKYNYKI